jgi:hypothetical protein
MSPLTVLTAQGVTPVVPPAKGSVIGDNAPPDPFTLYAESIEDLLLEANNYLDGGQIENEDQERAVASILTRLRREANAADDARKAEKRPHDEAAAAVQAKWAPLLKKADLAVGVAKNALASLLRKKEEVQRAAAEAAAQEARELADAAAQTAALANPESLSDQAAVRIRQENAADAAKRAERLAKQPVQAKGGERAVSLRSSYRAELTDPVAFARWAWEHRKGELLTFLEAMAQRECRAGPKSIPGITVREDRKAV